MPNLFSSGTSMPPVRAVHVSGMVGAVETRIALTHMNSVCRPVENQVPFLP